MLIRFTVYVTDFCEMMRFRYLPRLSFFNIIFAIFQCNLFRGGSQQVVNGISKGRIIEKNLRRFYSQRCEQS